MKVGVALAGGGLKGVAYIGALKAFEELGIKLIIYQEQVLEVWQHLYTQWDAIRMKLKK